MKKTSLFLLMTLFATLSFSADSITRKVSVTGTVEKEIMPDTANISFRIITKNKSLKVAGEESAKTLEKFKSDLKAKGVVLSKMETKSYFSQKTYDYDETIKPETKTTYRTTLGFEISIDTFENITKLIEWAQVNKIKSIKRNYDEKNIYYLEIVKDGDTKESSYNNALAAFNKMENELSGLNINESNIYLQGYSSQKIDTPVNNQKQAEINNVYSDFTVEIKDLKYLNDLLDIAEKDNVAIQGTVAFDISNREEIESELYRDAYEQAKRKGQSILKSSELVLSDPLVVSESVSYQYQAINDVKEYDAIYSTGMMAPSSKIKMATADFDSRGLNKAKVDYKPQALKITKDISVLFEMVTK